MASAAPFSTAGAEPTSEMPTDEPAHFVEERVAILDLAEEIGVRQQWLFKVARRLSIGHIKRREPARGNQLIATVTPAEAARIRTEVARSRAERRSDYCLNAEAAQSPYMAEEVGVFYIIQLEPQFDPGRFKLGWAGDIEERLRKHRCVAPFAVCVKTWSCRRAWEQTAIHKVADGSERLHTEVFRAGSLAEIVERADAFFSMMPKVAR